MKIIIIKMKYKMLFIIEVCNNENLFFNYDVEDLVVLGVVVVNWL